MKKSGNFLIGIFVIMLITGVASAQKTITVRFKETDEVFANPGIGFTTFQRFNGDKSNEGAGWTEGKPIEYQKFEGDLTTKDYPVSSIAYFRVYWKYLEPEMGNYNWEMIDYALRTAHERHQSLMLRVAPYGQGNSEDVPDWFRKMVGPKRDWKTDSWIVDPEDPRYAEYFGKLITALANRYDGHPDFESIDVSIVGFWGEGSNSILLTRKTREALVSSYTRNFKKTPMVMLLTDEKTNKFGLSQADVGWRVDCQS